MQVYNVRNDSGLKRLLLLGGVSFICLGAAIGGFFGWNHHHKNNIRTNASAQYFLALEGNKAQQRYLDLADGNFGKISEYAAIRSSDLARKDKLDAQAKGFLTQGKIKDEPLTGLALLMLLNLKTSQLEEAHSDQGLAEIRKGYQELARTSPSWGDFAREGLVALDLRKGASKEDRLEAVRLLKEIIASSTSLSGMHQRAVLLLQALES